MKRPLDTLPPNIPKRGLNLDEAAEYCGVGTRTLQRHGPEPIRIGERVVYDRVALDGWLDGLTCPAPATAGNPETELLRAIHERKAALRDQPRRAARKGAVVLGAQRTSARAASGRSRGARRDGATPE